MIIFIEEEFKTIRPVKWELLCFFDFCSIYIRLFVIDMSLANVHLVEATFPFTGNDEDEVLVKVLQPVHTKMEKPRPEK